MLLLELLNQKDSPKQKGLRAKDTGCHMIGKIVIKICKFHRYLDIFLHDWIKKISG